MVIIMGVQYFEGKEHRYVDYPVADVLQMMGGACHPNKDERSRCVPTGQQTKKEFYKKSFSKGLLVESQSSTSSKVESHYHSCSSIGYLDLNSLIICPN